MDLGLGAELRDKAAQEQAKLRKKKQQQNQVSSIVPQAYQGAYLSLSGNQF